MTDRLTQLEAQISAAQAEIAEIKAGRPAAPPPPQKDEGVRITEGLSERSDLPSVKEMQKLFAVVRHRVPEGKHHDPDRPFRGFCAAFRYVTNCGRIAAPNAKYAVDWWMDGWMI